VRTEADAENPEGRDELKITGGIQICQSTQEEIEGSGAENMDDEGVTLRGPMIMVGCKGVKGMNRDMWMLGNQGRVLGGYKENSGCLGAT